MAPPLDRSLSRSKSSSISLVAETPGEWNHRPGAMLSAGSQTVLPTIAFAPATSLEFAAAANTFYDERRAALKSA